MKIKAAVLSEPKGSFEIEDVDLDRQLGPRDVLVRVVATGLCHTDLSVRDGHMPSAFPVLLGHEGAGIVEAVGIAVTKVTPGQHVVMAPASCQKCRNCLSGHPSYCNQGLTLNLPGPRSGGTFDHHRADGTPISGGFFGQSSFANYVRASETSLVPVDESVSLELLGPLGCGFQTGAGTVLNVLRPSPGESIAVFGTGPVGMAAIMAAHAAGCETIIAVDINDHRLSIARSVGATHVVNSRQKAPSTAIGDIKVEGVDYTVDTTGRSDVINEALASLRTKGRCALIAVPSSATLEVSWPNLMAGRTLEFVPEGDSVPEVLIPQLISLYRRGTFPFDKLIKIYEFDQIDRAIAEFESGLTIKAVLRMSH